MDEARRFVRFVIPGLLFVIEYVLMTWIVLPAWIAQQVTHASKNFSMTFGGFLMAGGLGYFFHTLHHCCQCYLPWDRGVIDHSGNIRNCQHLIDHPAANDNTDRRTALDLTLIIWYSRLNPKHSIGNADKMVTGLRDVAHSAGAARVASFCALAAAMFTTANVGELSLSLKRIFFYLLMCLVGVALILLFDNTFRRTGSMFQRVIDGLIEQTLRMERSQG